MQQSVLIAHRQHRRRLRRLVPIPPEAQPREKRRGLEAERRNQPRALGKKYMLPQVTAAATTSTYGAAGRARSAASDMPACIGRVSSKGGGSSIVGGSRCCCDAGRGGRGSCGCIGRQDQLGGMADHVE